MFGTKEVMLVVITSKTGFSEKEEAKKTEGGISEAEASRAESNIKRINQMVSKITLLETETKFSEKRQESHMTCNASSHTTNLPLGKDFWDLSAILFRSQRGNQLFFNFFYFGKKRTSLFMWASSISFVSLLCFGRDWPTIPLRFHEF